MSDNLEYAIRMFRESLLSAFKDWLEKNRETIGDKWYDNLLKQAKEADADTAIKIMSTALWIFNMVAEFGVLAGIGPNSLSIHEINPELDEASTKRLLLLIQSCMNLQYLPRDVINREIPIISGRKFSLKLWTEQQE